MPFLRRYLFLVFCLFVIAGAFLFYKTGVFGEDNSSGSLVFSPSETSARVGEPFSVSVVLDTGQKEILGTDVIVKFDKSLFELVAVNPLASGSSLQSFLPQRGEYFDNLLVVSRANESGVLEFGAVLASPSAFAKNQLFQGSVVLAELIFKPLGKTTPVSPNFIFEYLNGSTIDSNIVGVGENPTDMLTKTGSLTVRVTGEQTNDLPPVFTLTPAPTLPTPFVISLTPTPMQMKNGAIFGRVTDKNGKGLRNVKVALEGAGKQSEYKTGRSGNFVLRALQPGVFRVYFSKDGYQDLFMDFLVKSGETTVTKVNMVQIN